LWACSWHGSALAEFATLKPTPKPEPVVIYDDNGGSLMEYYERWQGVAASGADIEILGRCWSACTILIHDMPKDRLCFGPDAFLHFHMVMEVATHEPDWAFTTWMIAKYPPDIRNWINAKGGVKKMPFKEFWTLTADELYEMGYRKCDERIIPMRVN
jgi:hypothetical protein